MHIFVDTSQIILEVIMLRKISLVLLALLIALSSTSCSSNQTWLSSRIIKNTTGLESHSTIFVDEEADVMYLLYSIGSQSGLTMMLNTEGKPKLSNDTEYKTRAINSSSKILVDDENGVLYFFGIMNGESGLVAMYDENGMPRLEKDTQYNVTKIESFGTNEYSGSLLLKITTSFTYTPANAISVIKTITSVHSIIFSFLSTFSTFLSFL